MKIYGPNKYNAGKAKYSPELHAELRPSGAVEDRNYKLTIGVIDKSGTIYYDIVLSYLNGTEYTELYNNEITTKVTVEEMKTALNISLTGDLKGKIILYGAMKGQGNTTTFKVSNPYTKQAQGGNA
jgi:hypothetical protein